MDGSNSLTDATTTVAINNGDRVAVRIQNHQAIITGNVTDISASGAQQMQIIGEVEEVEEDVADAIISINNLSSDLSGLSAEVIKVMDAEVGENLLPYPYYYSSRIIHGVTFTVLEDGTIIADGQNDGTASYFYLTQLRDDPSFFTTVGMFMLSGCPEGGSASRYFAEAYQADEAGVYTTLGIDYGTGVGVEMTSENVGRGVCIRIVIAKNYKADNIIFKPMFEQGEIKHNYQPYQMSRNYFKSSIKLTGDAITQEAVRAKNAEDEISGRLTVATDNISLVVKGKDSTGKVILTDDALDVIADNINLTGKVTFSSLDSATQTAITNANTNATNALSKANGAYKSSTIHYLATSASSGVTKSTSGWTTTVQTVTSTKKYLWTYNTFTKADNTTEDTTPVITGVYGDTGAAGAPGDKGDKGDPGAAGISVTSVVPLYYASKTATAPSAPTSAVSSASTNPNAWRVVIPAQIYNNERYQYVYACSQIKYSNNTYTWSTVTLDSGLSNMAAWCSEMDQTVIDGSKIYTGSITADQINVGSLMANDIVGNTISLAIGDNTIAENIQFFPYDASGAETNRAYGGGTSYTNRAIKFDVQEDGSIIANGTNNSSTSNAYFYLSNSLDPLYLDANETYTVSGGGGSVYIYVYEKVGSESAERIGYSYTNAPLTFVAKDNAIYYLILRVAASATVTNAHIYPMIEKGSIAREYQPYE